MVWLRGVPAVAFKDETRPANCPLCGREMSVVSDPKEFSVQACRAHGVFIVDKPTNDTWVLEGFDGDMAPIRRRWYEVENHVPLTVEMYRDMLKRANLKRLEGKPAVRLQRDLHKRM